MNLAIMLFSLLIMGFCEGMLAERIMAQDRWQPSYAFEHLSQEQGLSNNTVTCFTQDKNGFLWIATFDGLNRFDGMNFKIFRHTHSYITKNDSVKNRQVSQPRSMATDKNGMIWIVNFDNTVQCLNPQTERITNVRIAEPFLSRDRAASLFEDSEGGIWLSSDKGLYRFNTSQNLFERVLPINLPPESATALGVIIEERISPRERRFWVRQRGGLLEVDPDRKTSLFYPITNNTLDQTYFFGSAFVRDSSGYLWFSDTEFLYCFDTHSKSVIARYSSESYIRLSLYKNMSHRNFHFQIGVCTSDGSIWWGSFGGIVVLKYRTNPGEATFQMLQHDEGNPMSLSGNAVRTIFVDKTGVIWVGGEPFGINKYTPYKQKFMLFRHSTLNNNTLANNYVRGICQSRDGTLWVGTQFGGVSRYNPETRIWTRFQDVFEHNIPKNLRLPSNEVWSVFEDHQGIIWAGTRGKGLLKFNRAKEQFEQSSLVPEDAIVQVITEDRSGNLLVGLRGVSPSEVNKKDSLNPELFEIPPSRSRSEVRGYKLIERWFVGIPGTDVVALREDSTGLLWIGSTRKLFTLDRKKGVLSDKTQKIVNASGIESSFVGSIASSILEDREGTIWITSKGAGLARYDRAKDSFIAFSERDGLPNNSVYAMLEDGQGNFWISSDAGLSVWYRNKNAFRTFTVAEGLQGREFNRLSYFRNPETGMMFFGGTNGLNAFHPDEMRFNSIPPAIALTSLKIFAEDVLPETTLQTLPSGQKELRLRHDQNFLTFQFAALDFHVPQNTVYAYMLEGVDKSWVQNGTKREAVYTNLDPGKYTLRIRAANNDGVWNNEGLLLHLVILPPWWKTWWFRTILILSGLGAIVLVIQNYRNRIRRLQEHRRELLLHIDERQRAEAEMQRSEEKFRALFETSTLGMVLWQNDGVILEANAAFMRLLGFNRHECESLNFWQILGETHSSSITYSLQQRSAFGPIEQTLSQSNDEKISVVMYGIAIGNHNEHQDFERIWSVIEDITERKRATDALLRYQLNPHFMFNVLNSVNALMVENQRNAKRMIIQFSSLLRHTLVASTRQTAPLGDEIDAVEHYLAIEKIRFEERLEAVVQADRATLGLNVPVFLVQPLVENAIKYGMQNEQTTLHIIVLARIESDELYIEVANTGKWLDNNEVFLSNNAASDISIHEVSAQTMLTKKRSTGIGLTNLRKRLEQYYPQSHSMTIVEEEGMVKVRIMIALKELSQAVSHRVSM